MENLASKEVGRPSWRRSLTANAIGRRYVTVPGSDEIIAEYKVSNGSRNYKVLDERGSVLAATDASGNATAIDSYDEYGIPGAANTMRYQYTGQVWLSEIGLYYYKARLYSPTLGRFMQTDPIGYGDGMNWYNYVKGDPVNGSDPSGMGAKAPITNSSCDLSEHCGNDITIYGKYLDGGDDITIFGTRLDSVSLFGTNVCGNGQCTGFGAWRIEPSAIPVLGQSADDETNEKDIVITATKNQTAPKKPPQTPGRSSLLDDCIEIDANSCYISLPPAPQTAKEKFCAQEDKDIADITTFAGLSGVTALSSKLNPVTRALAAAGAATVAEIWIEKRIVGCK